MTGHYLRLGLLGMSICFLDGIVAREAIVGGNKSLHNLIQYQATILIHDRAPRCGGGIISEHAILTAAHCVINVSGRLLGKQISVLVGTSDLEVEGLVVAVDKIIVPMEYKPWLEHPIGDIAVLKLKSRLESRKYVIKVLELPRFRKMSYDYKTATIAGFGWDVVYENNVLIGEHSDNHLRYIDNYVLNDQQCELHHPSIINTEKQICAKVPQDKNDTRRRGACIGDGGGPLVRLHRIAIGVLSETTIGCAEKMNSGIYTRVSYYRDFIYNAIHELVNKDMWVMRV